MAIDTAYIMFTDIKGFSKLDETNYKVFAEIYDDISKIFKKDLESENIVSFNTWGDAIVLVSKDKNIVHNILKLRDYFKTHKYKQTRNFEDRNISDLKIRIGCHYGEFYSFKNEFTGKKDFIGTNVNLAARIEPQTRPNEIFVTQEFKNKLEDIEYIRFDSLGEIPLAKNFGSHEIYVLRKKTEPKQVIDILKEQDLIKELPDISSIKNTEKEKINNKYIAHIKKDFKKVIDDFIIDVNNSEELLYVTSTCKNKGYYNEAKEGIKKLKNFFIDMEGIKVYPYKTNIKLIKLEINVLTRIGNYRKAGKLTYNLWKSGNKDSDTLAMLAAQYKRRACIDKTDKLLKIYDEKLLKRALYLYLEAFRRGFIDENAYYPAINAAYISKILGSEYGKYDTQLTNYIITEWGYSTDVNWWVNSTIAEAYILQGDYDMAINKFNDIFKSSKPPVFELHSTMKQIELYQFYEEKDVNKKEISRILDLLNATLKDLEDESK